MRQSKIKIIIFKNGIGRKLRANVTWSPSRYVHANTSNATDLLSFPNESEICVEDSTALVCFFLLISFTPHEYTEYVMIHSFTYLCAKWILRDGFVVFYFTLITFVFLLDRTFWGSECNDSCVQHTCMRLACCLVVWKYSCLRMHASLFFIEQTTLSFMIVSGADYVEGVDMVELS